MYQHLQIYDPRERWLVGTADALLTIPAALARLLPHSAKASPPARILLLRLERIGDLLMSAPALASVRRYAPNAQIDLVVGSWNAALAALIPGIDRIETLDAPWLARGTTRAAPNEASLTGRAWSWRSRHYDLAINFEGDIRSHSLMALSGARRRIGFDMAGGGPLLTTRVPFNPAEHTTTNAHRLVNAAFSQEAGNPQFRLTPPAEARTRAAALLFHDHGDPTRPIIAVHASAGRAIKQWPPARFAEVAARLAQEQNARLLLTGSAADRPLVDDLRTALPPTLAATDLIDLVGEIDLPLLAATLERTHLLITGDTGPMHLAAAIGTPVVAVFGPSDPARYAPLAAPHRVVRVDLPCAPCNRIRLPPARCQGHTPDCLEGVTTDAVVTAARELLAQTDSRGPS